MDHMLTDASVRQMSTGELWYAIIATATVFLFLLGCTIFWFIQAWMLRRQARKIFYPIPYDGPPKAFSDFHRQVRQAQTLREREQLINSKAEYWKLHTRSVNNLILGFLFLFVLLVIVIQMIIILPRVF